MSRTVKFLVFLAAVLFFGSPNSFADLRTFILAGSPDGTKPIEARSFLKISHGGQSGEDLLYSGSSEPDKKVSAGPITFLGDYEDTITIEAASKVITYTNDDMLQRFVKSYKSLSPIYLIDSLTKKAIPLFAGLDKEEVAYGREADGLLDKSSPLSLCIDFQNSENPEIFTNGSEVLGLCTFASLEYKIGTAMREASLSSSSEEQTAIKANDSFSRLTVTYGSDYSLRLVPGKEKDTKVALDVAVPVASFDLRKKFSSDEGLSQKEIDNRAGVQISVSFMNRYGDGKAPDVYLLDSGKAFQISSGNKRDGSCTYFSLEGSGLAYQQCPLTLVASGSTTVQLPVSSADLLLPDLENFVENPGKYAPYVFSSLPEDTHVWPRGPLTGTYAWKIQARTDKPMEYYEYFVSPGGFSMYFDQAGAVHPDAVLRTVYPSQDGQVIERDFNFSGLLEPLFVVGAYEAFVELKDTYKTTYKNTFSVEPVVGSVTDISGNPVGSDALSRIYSFSSTEGGATLDPVSVFLTSIIKDGEHFSDNLTLTKVESEVNGNETTVTTTHCFYGLLDQEPIVDGYLVSYTGVNGALVTFSFIEECTQTKESSQGVESGPGESLLYFTDQIQPEIEIHLSDGSVFIGKFDGSNGADFSTADVAKHIYSLTVPVSIPNGGLIGSFSINLPPKVQAEKRQLISDNLAVLALGLSPSSPGTNSLKDYLASYPVSPAQFINGISVGRPQKISDEVYAVPVDFGLELGEAPGGLIDEPLDVRVFVKYNGQTAEIVMQKNGSLYTAHYVLNVRPVRNPETDSIEPVELTYGFSMKDASGRIYANSFLSKTYSFSISTENFGDYLILSLDTGVLGEVSSLEPGQTGYISLYIQSYIEEDTGIADLYFGLVKEGRVGSGPQTDGEGVVYLSQEVPGSTNLVASALEKPAATFSPSAQCKNAGECKATLQFHVPQMTDPAFPMFLGEYKWITYVKRRSDGKLLGYAERPFSIGRSYWHTAVVPSQGIR